MGPIETAVWLRNTCIIAPVSLLEDADFFIGFPTFYSMFPTTIHIRVLYSCKSTQTCLKTWIIYPSEPIQ